MFLSMISKVMPMQWVGLVGVLVVLVGGKVWMLNQEIGMLEKNLDSYKEKNGKLLTSIAVLNTNLTTCKTGLEIQNKAKEKVEKDLAEKRREFEEWKKMPPKVKYVKVLTYLPKDENASCSDIVDGVRSIDFNSL